MGTEPGRATSNRESSAAEGADMISEQTVTRFLNSTPMMACPDDVLARMRRTIAGEVELRRAASIDPDDDVPDLKPGTPLWSPETVSED